MKKDLILFGVPGAGKGTQSSLLASRLAFEQLSTGDLLRRAIREKSALGIKVESILSEGSLVSDEIVTDLVKDAFSGRFERKNVILDGYPRTLNQAGCLDEISSNLGRQIAGVINVSLPASEVIRRLSGRRVCPTCGATYHIDDLSRKDGAVCQKDGSRLIVRPDDEPDAVSVRLKTFDKSTKPLLDYYAAQSKLHTIDGLGTVEEVFARIKRVVVELDFMF